MARAQPGCAGALHLPAEPWVTLRPITPDDAKVLQAYVRGLSPESRYNRFLGALGSGLHQGWRRLGRFQLQHQHLYCRGIDFRQR